MDALALLCTLHADGPATLRQLRSTGCQSLLQLEAYEPSELARVLGIEPAVARRLAREARLLRERSAELSLDDEEAPGTQFRAPEVFETPLPASANPEATFRRTDRELIGRVLDRWRDRDVDKESESSVVWPVDRGLTDPREERVARLGVEAPAPVPRPVEVPRSAGEGAVEGGAEPAGAEPAGAVDFGAVDFGAVNSGLQTGSIDGLDAALAQRLEAAGIEDLVGLAAADGLLLARDLGLPFAEVRRLQFLARRAAPERESSETARSSTPESPETPGNPSLEPSAPRVTPTLPRADVQVAQTGTVLNWSFDHPPPTKAGKSAGSPDESAGGPFA